MGDELRRDGTLIPQPWDGERGERPEQGGGALQDASVSLPMQALSALLRWRRLLVVATLAGGLLSFLLAFVLPPVYLGTATFIAESQRAVELSSNLAGVAAQFGIPIPGGARERSPEFYVELIESDRVLRELLETRFATTRTGADSLPLIETLEVRGDRRALRLERGVRELRRLISASVELRSGIIRLEAEMPSPHLAASVANWLIREADEFNREVRQTQRRERRLFIEGRLASAQKDLIRAESALRTFLEHNRRYEDSPAKQFEEQQLRRQLDVAREVYLTLRRELETARIEEQNDVPVLTVVDPALPPQRKEFPRPLRMLVLGTIVGLLGASSIAFLVEYVRGVGTRDPYGRSAVVEQLRDARGDVRRLGLLRRRVAAGK